MADSRAKRFLAAALGTVLVFGAACTGGDSDDAGTTETAAAPEADPVCPLSGADTSRRVVERPAVAVKIENSPAAYPLSGLDDAEVVFEELVEGGLTRFMAIYHCTDTKKAGPVRSARVVDPPIMTPITRILAAAGGNEIVRKELAKAKIVTIDEDTPGGALRRISRPGITMEHTLYGNTVTIRKVGAERFEQAPPEEIFRFGDVPSGGDKARSVTLFFSQGDPIVYEWNNDEWTRSQHGQPFRVEGGLIEVDNVIVELHRINYSKTIVDPAGNPSIEIADPVGEGEALVFRDGRVFKGTWSRKAVTDRVVYTGPDGEEIPLARGTTWIALLPNTKGEVKGSYAIKPSPKKGAKGKNE
ncbi:MAG: DUF3048 domain-containing protein [Actinobacteria bacterium]|nr:DUF3048 domain-containing protein [Actinomycetota bacterium]